MIRRFGETELVFVGSISQDPGVVSARALASLVLVSHDVQGTWWQASIVRKTYGFLKAGGIVRFVYM